MSEIKNIDFTTLIAKCTACDFKEGLELRKPKSPLRLNDVRGNGG